MDGRICEINGQDATILMYRTQMGHIHGSHLCVEKSGNITSRQFKNGVEEVTGRGFVVLGKWLEQRHNEFCEIMGRIRKVVAAVRFAEKEERSKDKKVHKALLPGSMDGNDM